MTSWNFCQTSGFGHALVFIFSPRARLAFFPNKSPGGSFHRHGSPSLGAICNNHSRVNRYIRSWGLLISKLQQQKILNQPHGNSKYGVSHSPNHPKRSPMATVPLHNRSHNRIIYIEHRWTCLGTKQAKQCQTNDEEQETSDGFKWVSCHDLVRASRI